MMKTILSGADPEFLGKPKRWLSWLSMCLVFMLGQMSFAQFNIINNVDSNPTGWTLNGFTRTNSTFTPACEQSYHYYRNIYSSSTSGGTITSPNFTGASNGNEISISFVYKANEWSIGSGVNVDLILEYSTNNSTWNQIDAPINIVGMGSSSLWELPCTTYSTTLPAGTVAQGSDFKFRIRGVWNSGDARVAVDNISIIQVATTPPNCVTTVTPVNEATNVAKNVTLSWVDAIGAPTSYDVYFGESATPSFVGNVTTTTYTVPEVLAANTTYFWKVVPKNEIGDAIGCQVYSFTTGNSFVYCPPTYTNGCSNGSKISNVVIEGGITNISNNTGTTSCGVSGYTDFSSTHSAEIQRSTQISYTIGVGSYAGGVKIWIDFNQNGSFDEDELVAASTNTITSGGTFSGDFLVPESAQLGETKMRIRVVENSTIFTACSSQSYGEAEDYMIIISPAPACVAPNTLTATNLTYNSAVLSWINEGNNFDILWGESGFDPNTNGNLETGFANGGTLNGLTPLTNYEFYVRQDCGSGVYSIWVGPVGFKTLCVPASIVSTSGADICGVGEAVISAQAEAGANIVWFDSATGGNKLALGDSFTTPVLSETTSYWVSAIDGDMGNGARLAPTSNSATNSLNYGLVFTATQAFVLETVDVYLTGTAGVMVVNLTNTSGTVLQTRSVALPAGNTNTPLKYTVTLDFDIEPGQYRLIAASSPNMVRESSIGGFPYAVGDVATITDGYISGTSTSYYYFYNWSYRTGCPSPRQEVVVTVTPAPAFALSETVAEICSGDATAVITIAEGASSYDTYSWSPSTGVSGDATSGWVFNPSETTIFTLTASQSSGAGCVSLVDVTVNVNPLPTAITVNADQDVCENEIVQLSVSGNINQGIAVLGTATASTPSSTSWPNPFSKFYGGVKHQMLYTAAELSAQGLVVGSEISAISFDFATINTSANNVCTDFTIRMGHTNATEMTSGFVSGTTNVYGPLSYVPTQTGLVTFELNSVFVWDGVSNLIVETVHNSGNSGGGSGTTTKASNTSFVSVYRGAKDSVQGGIAGFDSATNLTVGSHSVRPDVRFVYTTNNDAISWAPADDLYMDEDGTIPYVADTYATVVYYKPSSTGNVSYSATSYTDMGCTISDTIEITVNAIAATPTGDATQALDFGATLADLVVSGDNLVWYADADLTTVLPNTTQVVDGATYYVTSATGGCESTALAITVTVVNPCAGVDAPTGAASQTLNDGQSVSDLDVTGEGLLWYADADLTIAVDITDPLTVGSYTFYVTQTVGSCTSSALAITVTVVDPCAGTALPTADSPQEMTEGDTVADIVVVGDNLTWYSDADLTTVVDPSFVLTEGSYTFYVTQTLGDCTSEAIQVVVEVALSSKDFDLAAFRAYPNPVSDIFTVAYNKNILEVVVYNMLGQQVAKQTVNATDAQVNMTQLPAGNYVVRVAVEGAIQTLKVVKQ